MEISLPKISLPLFLYSSFKRIESFGSVEYEKMEHFQFQVSDSFPIHNLYLKVKKRILLDSKIDVVVKEGDNLFANIRVKLSEFEDGNRPILDGITKIFKKPVSITVSSFLTSADFSVNEFTIIVS